MREDRLMAAQVQQSERVKVTKQIRAQLGGLTLHVVLGLGALIMLVPFIWMVSTSFKTIDQVFTFPPNWIPNPFIWENYPRAFTSVPFGRWFLNSLQIAILGTIGQLFTCSLAGFTFARMRFPGREQLFLVYLGTLMIPAHVTIIPIFVTMNWLKLVDTPWSLILPGLTSAWGTFLFRQYFLTLPSELEDAAKIDGCGFFRIYRQISLPLAKPVLATLAVFTFMASWTDFQGLANWPVMMAGIVISTLPILIAFVIGQKYFVRGLALTGIKG